MSDTSQDKSLNDGIKAMSLILLSYLSSFAILLFVFYQKKLSNISSPFKYLLFKFIQVFTV